MNSSRKASYNIIATKEFQKNLEGLEKQRVQRIVKSVEDLAQNPFLDKPLKGGLRGLYSLRIGEYRAIYSIEGKRRELIN